MYIKIWRPSPVAVSSEAKPGDDKLFREISWLTIETTRFSRDMYPREGVDNLLDGVDEVILRLRPNLPEGAELEYDEVCVLRCHAPEELTIVFDTEAYICNDRGDTIEKICPQYRIKPGKLKRSKPYLCAECHAPKHKGECPNCGVMPTKDNAFDREPMPCLKCGVSASRMFKLFTQGAPEWMGSTCDNCGDQKFEDWEKQHEADVFQECDKCRGQTGTPVLCADCLKRRDALTKQKVEKRCEEGDHRWSPWRGTSDSTYRYCLDCKDKQTLDEFHKEDAKKRA